jgi:hypothetical protein
MKRGNCHKPWFKIATFHWSGYFQWFQSLPWPLVLFTHSIISIVLFNQSFHWSLSFIHFIGSVHSFQWICSFIHFIGSVHSFRCSFIHFIGSVNSLHWSRSFIHSFLWILSFISLDLFIHSFLSLFIHSFHWIRSFISLDPFIHFIGSVHSSTLLCPVYSTRIQAESRQNPGGMVGMVGIW